MRGRALPLAVLAAALAAATAARLGAALESGNALNHVSGAWIALADDLARGTLYRPLASPDGVGGTRFFPGAFALHAGLLRLGGDPLATGHLLAIAAGLGICGGLLLLHRRLGLEPLAAAAFAVLPLAGAATQLGLASIRGDLLPVALQALALGALASGAAGAAALLLALALATKPTAIAAAAAAAAWLLLRGERRAALRLAALTAALAAALLGAAELASGGRFADVLASCAAGGASPGDVLAAPLRLAGLLAREDPGGLALLAAAAVALGAAARARDVPGLPALWLGATLAVTVAVLASPGTGVNHLADVEAASAAALAGCGARAAARRLARWAACGLAAAGVALTVPLARADRDGSRLDEARRVLAAVHGAPLLSEDALLPLLRGERPYLLDPFMLRVVAERDPLLARPLAASLRAGAFPAVVLLHDPFAPEAAAWYGRVHLGPMIAEAIRARYAVALRAGRYVLLVPRPLAPGSAPGNGAPPETTLWRGGGPEGG